MVRYILACFVKSLTGAGLPSNRSGAGKSAKPGGAAWPAWASRRVCPEEVIVIRMAVRPARINRVHCLRIQTVLVMFMPPKFMPPKRTSHHRTGSTWTQRPALTELAEFELAAFAGERIGTLVYP